MSRKSLKNALARIRILADLLTRALVMYESCKREKPRRAVLKLAAEIQSIRLLTKGRELPTAAEYIRQFSISSRELRRLFIEAMGASPYISWNQGSIIQVQECVKQFAELWASGELTNEAANELLQSKLWMHGHHQRGSSV